MAQGRKPKPRAFPSRIMLDSGVVIRALEHTNPNRLNDSRVAECREVWVKALRESTIILPPFVALEFAMGEEAKPFPRVPSVQPVAFSLDVVEAMVKWARPKARKKVAKDTKTVRRVVEYDALIVACAEHYQADTLVTLDADVVALAKLARVKCASPHDLLRWSQTALPF